jgi:hypothetical protein
LHAVHAPVFASHAGVTVVQRSVSVALQGVQLPAITPVSCHDGADANGHTAMPGLFRLASQATHVPVVLLNPVLVP